MNISIEELTKARNELYSSVPTGIVNAFELCQIIQKHLKKLDELIEKSKKEVNAKAL